MKKTSKSALLMSTLAYLLFAATLSASQARGTIRGQVVESHSAALPGVVVSVQMKDGATYSTITDSQGRFRLLAPPGTHQVRFELDGFLTTTETVSVPAGGTAYVTVQMRLAEVVEELIVTSTTRRSRNKSQRRSFHTEQYDRIVENDFRDVGQAPRSTFSIDVDTASYSNVRRFLEAGELPPADAVRVEELINYFSYDYPPPAGGEPFSVSLAAIQAPWKPEHLLARIALQGRKVPESERPAANLVFLIDVSGSMDSDQKLPLVKDALRLLVERLQPRDRVGIVVYAGAAGMILSPTAVSERQVILDSLERLQAGGSTNGAEGIRLAYDLAAEHFLETGLNRVIIATDGDFNVGVTSRGELTRLIEGQAKRGVFLSVLGFGMGNLKDATLERLADRGNGHYAYIDNLEEARRVLVEGLGGTLQTLAKDVKIQVEFNPTKVAAYRLVGYENRLLDDEDFDDDSKDAGEIGAGHSVTALYEIVPVGVEAKVRSATPLKYQRPRRTRLRSRSSGELMTVQLRYKEPDATRSQRLEAVLRQTDITDTIDRNFQLAAAAAVYGMLLHGSEHRGDASWELVAELAGKPMPEAPNDYRDELVRLARIAEQLQTESQTTAPRVASSDP